MGAWLHCFVRVRLLSMRCRIVWLTRNLLAMHGADAGHVNLSLSQLRRHARRNGRAK